MTDIVVDGKPFETPIGAATEAQARTPPSLGDAFMAQFHDSETLEPVVRWAERSAYMDTASGRLGRSLAQWGAASVGGPLPFDTAIKPLPAPVLSAEEANAKYAPTGPDGKPVPITQDPLPEPVAQMVGKAKTAEIERQGVLARYYDAHSWPVTFTTGIAAFMMDPLNLGASFIPGIGEEAALAKFGSGIAARTAARVVAGGTAGAISQVPITALRYSLGQGEAADYSLKDAFRDVAFAAAGNALVHTGIGTTREILAKRAGAPIAPPGGALGPAPAGEAPGAPFRASVEEESALGGNAETKEQAMRVAAAQIAEGKPIEVRPVLSEREAAIEREQVEMAARDLAAQQGQPPQGPPKVAPRAPTLEQLKGEPLPFVTHAGPEQLAALKARLSITEAAKPEAVAEQQKVLGDFADKLSTAPDMSRLTDHELGLMRQVAERRLAEQGYSIDIDAGDIPGEGSLLLDKDGNMVDQMPNEQVAKAVEMWSRAADVLTLREGAEHMTPADAAAHERTIAAAGTAPGIPAGDLERVNTEVYGTNLQEPAAAGAEPAGRKKPAAGPPEATSVSQPGAAPQRVLEERIQVPAVATELARMRENTGWAQVGGKHLGGEMGKPNFSTWIPNEEWWPGRPKGLSEAKAKVAITKALDGKPLNAGERRFVEYATDVAESHAAGEEYNPTKAELKEYDVPKDNANDAALVARAAEQDEGAVERAAMEHGEDYAGFMRAVKEIADAKEKPGAQGAEPGELPAREAAGEAPGRAGEEGQPAPLPGDLDAELAHAEQALASAKARGEEVHPEDAAELERANAELADANAESDAMLEAATCLGEAIA